MATAPEPTRPDPDALLAKLEAEEVRAARGKLKIFFGASPGVGKTYAMLVAAGQLRAQAPHSMQRSLSVTAARLSCITKTPRGQTSAHRPQPAHLSGEYARVVTFARYFISRSIP